VERAFGTSWTLWAGKDFTHFNRAGANKIADMLFKLLVEGE
jgi:lysophospholipase L1-like esterase